MLEVLSRAVAQLTAGAFAGICVHIMLVQHPVRMALPAAPALDDFRAVIPCAEKIQAPLPVVCLLTVAVCLTGSRSWPVVVGGLLMLVVLVQTLAMVLPINRRLLAGEAADHVQDARQVLARVGPPAHRADCRRLDVAVRALVSRGGHDRLRGPVHAGRGGRGVRLDAATLAALNKRA